MEKYKVFLSLFIFLNILSITFCSGEDFAIELEDLFVKRNLVRDTLIKPISDWIHPDLLINNMGFGISLGNTLDAYIPGLEDTNQGLQSETSWGNPYTSREMIDAIAKKGIKTLRLPVTWHNHLIDDSYTIDPEWMKRVKTIVDWAIENDMYVIINTHHDNAIESPKNAIKYGSGYYPSIKDAEESERFLYNVWRQIALAFNNGYDHHLIFEGLNIPRLVGTLYEYNYDRYEESCEDGAKIINEYNQLILYTIRESGGNNLKRYVLVSPYAGDLDILYQSGFEFPDDSRWNPRSERLLLSLHMFTPIEFTKSNDMDFVRFEERYQDKILEDIEGLYNNFVKQGYHVVITEMGTVNKNNTEERINWADYFIRTARKFHISCILWDNNYFDNSESSAEVFGLFRRKELKWDKEGLIQTYIRRSEVDFLNDRELFAITLHEYFDYSKIIEDEGEKIFDDEVTAEQVSEEIGLGWNLGNTMDAFSSKLEPHVYNEGLEAETVWGNPYTSEAMIKELAEKGIHTIRIPVSWHTHLIDEDYTIDPEWMLRVKEIVDWCLKYKLYVIINSHHDNHFSFEKQCLYGNGYYPNYRDIIESERFIFNIWRQIALAFNNGYDHHLIFEGLNEPRLAGYKYEWNYEKGDVYSEEAVHVLNEYMRLIVKAIRETGGNNRKRFILITPYAAQYNSAMNSGFIMPDDKDYNPRNPKLMLSVHMYTPYPFALGYSWKDKSFGYEGKKELYDDFRNLYTKLIANGIQIVLGEFGSLNKKNTQDRLSWAKYYTTVSRTFHMSCILWDNNFYKDKEEEVGENLGEFHRETLEWDNEDIINAYLQGEKTKFMENPQ